MSYTDDLTDFDSGEIEPLQRVKLIVETEAAGRRLDAYLASVLPDLSRSYLQHLIGSGNVQVDGADRKQNYRVTSGESIEIMVPEPQPHDLVPQEIPLQIVYEDADIAVIDKPAGMVVHPAAGHPDGTLVNALLARYPEIDINGTNRPGIVHRLDKDTSGLIVIARSVRGQRLLLDQWADGTVGKGYTTLVHGVIEEGEATIDAPIGRHPTDRQRMAVMATGKPAVTHFSVVRRLSESSLLDVRIDTGRTHQIRVHLAYIGHPVAGDRLYGGKRGAAFGLERQFLHASRLRLRLPDGRMEQFDSALPADLLAALRVASGGESS